MLQKPYNVWPSPRLVTGVNARLWDKLALLFAANTMASTGGSTLVDSKGAPMGDLTAGSTLQWRGTPYGLGVGISGASDVLEQANFEPITTSDGAGTGDLTMIVLANPGAEARISMGLSQGNSANNTTLFLGFNTANSLATATSGAFCFTTRQGASTTGASIASVVDGNYHLFGGRRRGTNVDCFADNLVATASGTIQDITPGTGGIAIGHRAERATDRIATTTSIVLAAAWNRALTDAEMRLLADDPFCMFRPEEFYYKAAAAAGNYGRLINPSGYVGGGGYLVGGGLAA